MKKKLSDDFFIDSFDTYFYSKWKRCSVYIYIFIYTRARAHVHTRTF